MAPLLYDFDLWFLLGHKGPYDADYDSDTDSDSVASEIQPLGLKSKAGFH